MFAFIQFAAIFLCLFVIGYFIFWWNSRRLYAFAAQLNGPQDYPLIGVAHKFLGLTSSERFTLLLNLGLKWGNLSRYWLGPTLTVFVEHPDDLQVVLRSPNCYGRPYFVNFLDLTNGLLTTSEETWKIHRKYLNSSFNLKILKSYIPIFNQKSLILTQSLNQLVGQGQFDIYQQVGRCILDIVCATSLNTNLNIQNDVRTADNIIEGLNQYMNLSMSRIFNIHHYVDFFYKMSTNYVQQQLAMAACFGVIRSSVKNSNNDELPEDEEHEEYKKPQILINRLYRLSKESSAFDEKAITDEINTIFLTGFDSSSLMMSHILLMLAIHPEVQEKVVAELKDVFYDLNEEPEHELLSKLVYMDMVIKEVLRLLPGVPIYLRVTTNDVQLATKDVTIPANVVLVISPYLTHRSKEFWGPDAEKFNPENFSAENMAKRHPYAFLPFSHGKRDCMGKVYFTLAMKSILVNLLRCYKFRTTYTMDTIRTKIDISLKLAHQHLVSIEKRNF